MSGAIDGRRWYVVHAKPLREAVAVLQLTQREVETFFPRLALPDHASARRRLVPLFPGYLFARLEVPGEIHAVLWSPGVKALVGPPGAPTAVDDGVVDYLRARAMEDGVIPARSELRAGQEVRLRGGPFDGLVAIIQAPPDGQGRVRVLMRLLNRRTVRVRVPGRFVEGGWVA